MASSLHTPSTVHQPAPLSTCAPPVEGTPSLLQTIAQRRKALIDSIQQLKTEKKAVVLAHLYERLEVQDIADYQGDSLGLSQEAAQTDADVIIFCGVHFMAETAKLLSPEKQVFLANPNAGCPMADMITPEQLQGFKAQYPGAPVVAYVNTPASVKAESDYCCTSANAVDLVRQVIQDTGKTEVLFVPDKHLGGYVQEQLDKEGIEARIICWDGFCPTHLRMDEEDLFRLKKEHPQAAVLAHPECDTTVKQHAEFIGSTTAIVKVAKEASCLEFIVCTEDGVAQKLSAECPEKTFYTPNKQTAICPNMKMTRLENIQLALQGQVEEIVIPDAVAARARLAIDRMLAVPASPVPVPKLCGCQSKPS